jgi:2-iminoacetate synthase ThiH
VLFAPLYIANYCVNNCRYCAFRQSNKSLPVGSTQQKWASLRAGRGCAHAGRLDAPTVLALHLTPALLLLSLHEQRSALSEEQLREEVASLQQQGHRRLLVLTGEHPRYTFDAFLKAIDTISSGGQPSQRCCVSGLEGTILCTPLAARMV